MKDYYTVTQLAEKYGRCTAAVRRWFQSGQVPGTFKAGTHYRVPRDVIDGGEFEPPAMGRPRKEQENEGEQ